MDATATPPGCLVLLLDLSARQAADVVTPRGEMPAFVAARAVAEELVEGLVNTAEAGYEVGPLDVAVLGYTGADDGTLRLVSLLPGGDPKPRFVPLAQIVETPAGAREAEGQPRKWAVPPPCAGEPSSADALARVYLMVAVWLTGRFHSRPPVVIHCTGGHDPGEPHLRVARSLGLLNTVSGPVRLLHYAFGPEPDEGALEHIRPLARGAFANAWDIGDPWDALFTVSPQEDATDWAAAGAAFAELRAMWAQKMGNSPEQWEDAFACDPAHGAVAVADGASTGIYCSIWAKQLSERFLSDRPDARDPVALNKWVNALRPEWRTAINYSGLNWSKQAKVDQTGAAATLLGLEFGPDDGSGRRAWRACAVGDASLFWVRDGHLLGTFPVVAADQFGSAPLLVRSNPGFKTVALAASGTCEPGDRFLLATDAVAARLFKSAATGPGPDWTRFEQLDQDDWRAELDVLRRANDMVNDDCTLVVLRVNSGEPAPAASEEAAAAAPEEAPAVEDAPQEQLPPEPEVADELSEPLAAGVPEPPAAEPPAADAPDPPGEPAEPPAPVEYLTADAGDLMIELPAPPAAPPSPDPPHDPARDS